MTVLAGAVVGGIVVLVVFTIGGYLLMVVKNYRRWARRRSARRLRRLGRRLDEQ